MLEKIHAYTHNWRSVGLNLGILTAAVVFGLALHYVLFEFMRRLSGDVETTTLGRSLVKRCRAPSRLLMPLLTVRLFMPLTEPAPGMSDFLNHMLGLLMIVSLSWLAIRLALVSEDFILHRFDTTVMDNLRARSIHTQIRILRRIVIAIILVLASASILMTFSKIRQLGTSILASAGIIGIIVGFAAQRSIATLFAGFQVAMTQPIRLDDVVVVENEWGRIEEITLTYVVVRIWDLRRLILPVNYFLEKPFQNWTRVSAALLGSVFVYADYRVPLQAVREELQRILESSEHWDGKVCVLHVTDASERTLELRALMSAPDSSSAWELRCCVRERLVAFLQRNHPEALPVLRTEMRGHPSPLPEGA